MLPLSPPVHASINALSAEPVIMKRTSPYSLEFLMGSQPTAPSPSSTTTPRTHHSVHAPVHPYARPSHATGHQSYLYNNAAPSGYAPRQSEVHPAAATVIGPSMKSHSFSRLYSSGMPEPRRELYGRKRYRSPSPPPQILDDVRLYSSVVGPSGRRLSGESTMTATTSTTASSRGTSIEAEYYFPARPPPPLALNLSRCHSNSFSEPTSVKRSKPSSPMAADPPSPGCDHCGRTVAPPRTRDQPLTPEDHAYCFEEMFRWFRALVPRNGLTQSELLEEGCKLESTLYRYPPQTKAELLRSDIDDLRRIIVDWLRSGAKGRLGDMSGGITTREQKIDIVEKIWALYKGLESPGGGGANTPDWRGMAKTLNLAMGKDQGSKTGNERLRQMMDQRIKHLIRELRRTD